MPSQGSQILSGIFASLRQLVVRPLDKMALMVQKLTNTLYSMSEQQGLVERSEKESAQLMHEGDEDDDDEG